MTRFSQEDIKSHCEFNHLDVVERLVAKHTFVLCYGGHFVNFEMLTSLPIHLQNIGLCHLYLAAKDNEWTRWMKDERGKYGAINISSTESLRSVLKLRQGVMDGTDPNKGYVFGSLSDFDPKKDNKHSAPFLNHRLEVKTGAERIGRKLGMGFCYAHITRRKRGYYVVDFRELIPSTNSGTDKFAYTDEFVRQLDLNIREQPEIWMQWGSCRF